MILYGDGRDFFSDNFRDFLGILHFCVTIRLYVGIESGHVRHSALTGYPLGQTRRRFDQDGCEE